MSASTPILRAEHISLGTSESALLRDVTLDLPNASMSVLAGAVGAGKSLLARILAGLLEPNSGNVYFNGTPIKHAHARGPGGIAIVFQDASAHLIGSTVEEDVAIGVRRTRRSREECYRATRAALVRCGISHLAQRPISQLSGGEARLTAFASALALEPNVFICDEPFSNLDWNGVSRVLHVLVNTVHAGAAVLVVTHELEKVLAHARRLFLLEEGKVRLSVDLPAGLNDSARADLEAAGVRARGRIDTMSWLR